MAGTLVFDNRMVAVNRDGTWTPEALFRFDKLVRLASSSTTIAAAAVTFAPAGGIAATDVQAALEELDVDKEDAGTAAAAVAAHVALADPHTQYATDAALTAHTGDTGNPHSVTKTQVGLGNVTDDAQTKAAIVPNTVPTSGQILAGNAGGTAYAAVSMSGDATLASTGALTIANGAVTYAKMQDVSAASKLLGRGDSGSGDPQEITLGTNLSMSGTTLNAAGSTGATMVSAFLTATQSNNTTTPAVLTNHTFTLTPGQVLSLTGQVVCDSAAATTGFAVGVRVAQGGGADANAQGSVAFNIGVSSSRHTSSLFDGDIFDVAAGANTLRETIGTDSTNGANNGSAYQLSVKNYSTNADTTVTIEFRSEVAASAVTAQIGTGCAGVKG